MTVSRRPRQIARARVGRSARRRDLRPDADDSTALLANDEAVPGSMTRRHLRHARRVHASPSRRCGPDVTAARRARRCEARPASSAPGSGGRTRAPDGWPGRYCLCGRQQAADRARAVPGAPARGRGRSRRSRRSLGIAHGRGGRRRRWRRRRRRAGRATPGQAADRRGEAQRAPAELGGTGALPAAWQCRRLVGAADGARWAGRAVLKAAAWRRSARRWALWTGLIALLALPLPCQRRCADAHAVARLANLIHAVPTMAAVIAMGSIRDFMMRPLIVSPALRRSLVSA